MADIKDSIKTAQLMLKNDKRVWAIIGFLVICGFIVVTGTNPRAPRRIPAASQQMAPSKPISDDREAYKDLIHALKLASKKQEEQIEELKKSNERFQSQYKKEQRQIQGIFESLVDKMERFDNDLESVEAKTEDLKASGSGNSNGEGLDVDLKSSMDPSPFGFEDNTVDPPPPEAPRHTKITFISPGDSVKVKLLTGANAPVDGTPYPVVFQLMGPISGPDGSALELGEARIIAAAQGSEADGRVLFRLSDLAIRHKDGRRAVVKVDGWIVGEDGIRGMKGRLIDKLGRLIAATAGVSFFAALGERIEDKSGNIVVNQGAGIGVDRNDIDVSGVSAFVDSSDRLGQILLDRYEKLVPVVEVLSGREVVAVFSAPTEVSIIDEEEGDETIYTASSLD